MTVAADNQQSGQSQALFGADHMHNTLTRIAQAKQRDVIFRRIGFKISHHRGDLGIGNVISAAARWHIVIGDTEGELRFSDSAPTGFHLAEGVERALMHIMTIDPKQSGAVVAAHNFMRRP